MISGVIIVKVMRLKLTLNHHLYLNIYNPDSLVKLHKKFITYFQLLLDGTEVHGFLDDAVIVRHVVGIHWTCEP